MEEDAVAGRSAEVRPDAEAEAKVEAGTSMTASPPSRAPVPEMAEADEGEEAEPDGNAIAGYAGASGDGRLNAPPYP